MRILVTGGCGFVGSNLIKTLLADGHIVVSLDDYSSGSKENHHEGCTYIHGSTTKIFSHLSDFQTPFDLIYHLGEYSRVEESFNHVGKVLESNGAGTAAVLAYAIATKAKLIYAGSSTKFGDNGSASSPYAITKANNTDLVRQFGELGLLDYAITYFYNVFGPGEISDGSYATVVAKFLKAKEQGYSVNITTPGTQVRNFTHIDDIVAGLILVGMSGHGDGYGIGADETYSIVELANIIGVKWEMVHANRGMRHAAELVTKKTKELGWKQTKNLLDYILLNTEFKDKD